MLEETCKTKNGYTWGKSFKNIIFHQIKMCSQTHTQTHSHTYTIIKHAVTLHSSPKCSFSRRFSCTGVLTRTRARSHVRSHQANWQSSLSVWLAVLLLFQYQHRHILTWCKQFSTAITVYNRTWIYWPKNT